MSGNEKKGDINKSIKKIRIIGFILGNIPHFLVLFIIISAFLLAISIYSSLSNNGLRLGTYDDGSGGINTAGSIVNMLYGDGYDSSEPKGFPSTGYFSLSTFKKHFVDDRRWGHPSTAIDFWFDPSINEKSKLVENVGGSNKAIKDYDYSYLKMGNINSVNGPRLNAYCSGSRGLISRKPPIPVYSTHNGIVKVRSASETSYGNSIVVQGEKSATLYAHLYQVKVGEGQEVKAGELIGIIGNTGNSCSLSGGDGHHLHYEMLYVKGASGVTNDQGSNNDRRLRGYVYVTKDVFLQNLLSYGAREDGILYKGDHVGINVGSLLNDGELKSNDMGADGEMAEFLDYSVEGLKQGNIFSREGNDFFSKLLTWTILGRETSSSYNKNAKPNYYVLSSDGGAGIYQSQHVTDESLKKKYLAWGGYDGSDGDGLGNGKGQGCGVGTEGRRGPSTVTKQGLINRGCDLENDVRFDKKRVFADKFLPEIQNKYNNFCKKFVPEHMSDDYTKGLCIAYAYNAFNGTKAFKEAIINFREDVVKGTNYFEKCQRIQISSGRVSAKNAFTNCSYTYQYALNFILMKERGATQLNGLCRFQGKNGRCRFN